MCLKALIAVLKNQSLVSDPHKLSDSMSKGLFRFIASPESMQRLTA